MKNALTPRRTLRRVLVLGALAVGVAILTASNGAIVIVSGPNVVSGPQPGCLAGSTDSRFEPSSTATTTWVTSWAELPGGGYRYTSSWNLGAWKCKFLQTVTINLIPYATGDFYLATNSVNSIPVAVMAQLGMTQVPIWFKIATDSTGSNWSVPNAPIMPATGQTGWDFPSIAVGPNGRLVAGASYIASGMNMGYQTVVSTNSGSLWSSTLNPVPVDNKGPLSRIVYSASGYHLFTFSKAGNTWTLEHYLSPDGATNWVRQLHDISTFLMPNQISPGSYCGGGNCGAIDYAPNIDVATSAKLGWVVAYQVNDLGYNAINVNTELGGAVTINYATDLFLSGIASSDAGDWWLNYTTYSGALHRTLPLIQGVVYRTPGSNPSYPGGITVGASPGIDPTSWFYYPNTTAAGHCPTATSGCFSAGDYSRPAANIYASSSIPVVVQSQWKTNLQQSFLADPQTGNLEQIAVTVTPIENGADLRSIGIITPAISAEIASAPELSISTIHALASAGLLGTQSGQTQ